MPRLAIVTEQRVVGDDQIILRNLGPLRMPPDATAEHQHAPPRHEALRFALPVVHHRRGTHH